MSTTESCAVAGLLRPATTYSVNPDYSGYNLCYECAAGYDSRTPTIEELEEEI